MGKKCTLSNVGTTANSKITEAKLYVPVITLLTENIVKLTKQLINKRSVYWNKYKMIPNEKVDLPDNGTSNIKKLIDSKN